MCSWTLLFVSIIRDKETSMLLLALLGGSLLLGSVYSDEVRNMNDARNYLMTYFMAQTYSNPMFGELQTETEMQNTIRAFQQRFGLDDTGLLDEPTKKLMSMPRCGMPDMIDHTDDVKRRKKRYALQGSMWNKDSPLTYKITTYSPDLSRSLQDDIVANAFQRWSDVADIDFLRTSGNADIVILFAAGDHGDGSSFDGSGGTLAHAFFPQFGGDAHFDEDERWTHETFSGTNLLQVAIHEFGHSLGLSHSSIQDAIMAPFYRGYVPNAQLHTDDIEGIRALYGRRTNDPPTPAPTPATPPPTPATPPPTPATPQPTPATPPPTPATPQPTPATPTPQPPGNNLKQRFCQNLRFDAISLFGSKTYAFKDDLYVLWTPSGIAAGYPRLISDYWPGAPSNIDAALYWPSNTPPRLYIFKGREYWRYEEDSAGDPRLRSGYPRRIASGFIGLPDNIDNAFVWGRNGKTYVMAGDIYYRLAQDSNTEASRGQVDPDYPRSLSIWNLPSGVRYDAVFQWQNGRTYMFDGDQYIRYNDNNLQIDTRTSIPYPRPIEGWWTDCTSGGLQNNPEMEDADQNQFLIVTQMDDNDGSTQQTIVTQMDDNDGPTQQTIVTQMDDNDGPTQQTDMTGTASVIRRSVLFVSLFATLIQFTI